MKAEINTRIRIRVKNDNYMYRKGNHGSSSYITKSIAPFSILLLWHLVKNAKTEAERI